MGIGERSGGLGLGRREFYVQALKRQVRLGHDVIDGAALDAANRWLRNAGAVGDLSLGEVHPAKGKEVVFGIHGEFLCDYFTESPTHMQARLNVGMDTLAKRVKTRRKELKLRQEDVAAISGLKQSDISKIENGSIQKTTAIVGLARALQCDPQWLESGDGQEPGQPSAAAEPVDRLMAALIEVASAIQASDKFTQASVGPLFSMLSDPSEDAKTIARRAHMLLTTSLGTGQMGHDHRRGNHLRITLGDLPGNEQRTAVQKKENRDTTKR